MERYGFVPPGHVFAFDRSGWGKVLLGVTTIEEVVRVSEDDEALTEE